eukprot:scaffold9371_cov66-Cyclotella_meneghiniana.AAC.16
MAEAVAVSIWSIDDRWWVWCCLVGGGWWAMRWARRAAGRVCSLRRMYLDSQAHHPLTAKFYFFTLSKFGGK